MSVKYLQVLCASALYLVFLPLTHAEATAPAVPSPAPLSVFKDTLPGGVAGPAMMVMPAGSFDMGSDDAYTDEQPVHRVTFVKSFAIGVTEVTQKQWRDVMGEDPEELEFTGCDDCPVDNVSWDDTRGFLQKLNRMTGKTYRLPTEAEWEYACKAGNGRNRYCGGNDEGALAWYAKNSSADGERRNRRSHPVAGKRANAWGLYDMSGNMAEWVEDVFHPSYNGAPADGSARTRGANKKVRVMRGGSFDDLRPYVRATVRQGTEADWRLSHYGFRLARSLP